MKTPVAFVLGVAGGAILASALFLITQAQEHPANATEITTLREELSLAQKSVQRDRETLRTTVQELATLQAATRQPPSSVTKPLSPTTPPPPMAVPNNSSIETYLGGPVPAPANLDRKYSPEELAAVFRDLSETLGFKVEKLAVDTTEFPFIIYGRIESSAGSGFFKKIDAELKALPGYTYGGSVTGNTKEGSTYFALNMIPSSAYAKEQSEAIHRRLMIRLQMAAAGSEGSSP